MRVLAAIVVLATVAASVGCEGDKEKVARAMVGGDPQKGKAAINQYGCASCHTIPGIHGANALVGPPLTQIGARMYVAGMLQNTPPNMIRWIENPPAINARTAMPNLHVTAPDARDIATYLYTLQ
jgi:cytochrome c2